MGRIGNKLIPEKIRRFIESKEEKSAEKKVESSFFLLELLI